MSNNSLFNDGDDTDWTLREGHRSVWITVDDISIYIIRRPNGVEVEAYAKGMEMDAVLDGFLVEGDFSESNNSPDDN